MYFNKNANLSHYLVIKIEEFYKYFLRKFETDFEFLNII